MNNDLIDKYTVTAIISTYNSEKYFSECINDLIHQTLYKKNKLEIIIIDSNSTQNEFLIAKQFLKKFNHIRYIKTKQRETIYQAWNRGCVFAQGKFITNANTDDRHHHDALERLADTLESHPKAGVAYANCFITKHPNHTFNEAPIVGCFLWPQYDQIELFKTCFIGPQPMWRKSLHKQYGYFDGNLKSAGDYDFWLRLASAGVHFQHIPECLGLYLMSEEGMEHSNPSLSIQESELARSRHWKQEWGNRPTPGGTYLVPMQLVRSKWQTEHLEKPLVSVIIPTKDRPAMLREAVASALTQTYPYIEVVVINDAGADVWHELATIYDSSKITYVTLLRNSERSKSRNYGITIANGDYITYLDDDDIFYPNHVETLLRSMDSKKYDIAYADSLMAQQSLHNNEYKTTKKICLYSHEFNYENLLVENYIPILCLMHKKKCIENSGYFDEKISTHEDWDFCIRLAKQYNFLHIKKITSEYRVRDDNTNTTNSKLPKFLESFKYIYNKHPLPHSANAFTHLDRKRALFVTNLRAYNFICDLISSFKHDINDNTLTDHNIFLENCGALQKQIISAAIYLQSKSESNIKIQRHLLIKSLKADQENYLSWIDLCNNYITDLKFELVEETLKTLIEANPLDLTLYDSLIKIFKILNKNQQIDELIFTKKYILHLKENSKC